MCACNISQNSLIINLCSLDLSLLVVIDSAGLHETQLCFFYLSQLEVCRFYVYLTLNVVVFYFQIVIPESFEE